jgi:predicted nucleic-acid-binding protein
VLETLLYSPHIELVNKDQYLAALRLYGGGAQHFGDACACAAALERCEGRIVSVDRKLNRISGIQRSEQV